MTVTVTVTVTNCSARPVLHLAKPALHEPIQMAHFHILLIVTLVFLTTMSLAFEFCPDEMTLGSR